MGELTPVPLQPEPLAAKHDLSQFRNGRHDSLNDWLRLRAFVSESLSARTYVVCDSNHPTRVIGYYALAAATEQRVALPTAKLRRGLPETVPFMLIGRLAVDASFSGKGLGRDLLFDALAQCVDAARIIGIRGVIAHAIDDAAVKFYQRHEFLLSPLGERVMLLPIETVRDLVGGSN